ncbi:class I SAM-dependent methyltransferase [Paracoccus sp. NGMCC 1.201697]|uniref:Class I SAM-dependent methyltransferase n=1 Tax=Paracoccus broussonetiae subsp. drimophilus TaxID=3373869 RepID=A0ABW7LGI8_9RHOB
MSTTFNVHKPSAYDQLMGRWSRQLAPLFIEFAGVADGETVLDVGCGTGSLTFALTDIPFLSRIEAIDISPVFVEALRTRNIDARVAVQQGDAQSLPFQDRAFDRVFALLVLHFVPDADKAIAEMRRVARPGGTVAAAVWDHAGGMPVMRMLVDSIAAIIPKAEAFRTRFCFQPMTQPGELERVFMSGGLQDVQETELTIRMNYRDFDDFWMPIAAGEGPFGALIDSLSETERQQAATTMRAAYEAGRPDGPRSFTSTAWACRGLVP